MYSNKISENNREKESNHQVKWTKKYNDLKNVKAYVFQNVQVSKALGFTI